MTRRKPMFARPRRMSLATATERLKCACPRNVGRALAVVLREKYGKIPERFKKNGGKGALRRFFRSIREEAMRLERTK